MPDLKKHFNNEAEAFDNVVYNTITRYDEMLTALINAIPDTKEDIKVLDLGCGTGNITKKVLERFPKAQVTCLDLSENMINIAKDKLSEYENIGYVIGDFTTVDLDDSYDAIISSLALHHIESDDKKLEMYKDIHNSLNDNGVFYNADVIKANSKYNAHLNEKISDEFMKAHGVSQEDIDDHKQKRHANDLPITMIKHLKLLEEAGFTDIDIIWKYYSNAVYGGSK